MLTKAIKDHVANVLRLKGLKSEVRDLKIHCMSYLSWIWTYSVFYEWHVYTVMVKRYLLIFCGGLNAAGHQEPNSSSTTPHFTCTEAEKYNEGLIDWDKGKDRSLPIGVRDKTDSEFNFISYQSNQNRVMRYESKP